MKRELLASLLALTCSACASAVKLSPAETPRVQRTPFQIFVNTHVTQAPFPLIVRVRYDPATVRGAVCIFVEGPQTESSCWIEEGDGAPLTVRAFNIYSAGSYQVEVVSGTQRAVTQVEVQ